MLLFLISWANSLCVCQWEEGVVYKRALPKWRDWSLSVLVRLVHVLRWAQEELLQSCKHHSSLSAAAIDNTCAHTDTYPSILGAICLKAQQQATGCRDDLLHLLRNISWLWKSRKYKTCEMDSTSSNTSMDFWRPQVMHLELREARKTWGYAGCSDMQRKKTYWRISIGNSRKRKTQVGKCLKKKELGVLTQGQDSLWFLGWCLKYVWTHLRWVLRVQSRILWPPSC